MEIIFDWLRYPIKLLLRKKVSEYKQVLIALRFFYKEMTPKSRRQGNTYKTAYLQMEQMFLQMKYEAFIKKWEIK